MAPKSPQGAEILACDTDNGLENIRPSRSGVRKQQGVKNQGVQSVYWWQLRISWLYNAVDDSPPQFLQFVARNRLRYNAPMDSTDQAHRVPGTQHEPHPHARIRIVVALVALGLVLGGVYLWERLRGPCDTGSTRGSCAIEAGAGEPSWARVSTTTIR